MSGVAERTNNVCYIVAFVKVAKFCGRKTHLLHNNSDRTTLDAGICDGQRHTLATFTDSYDNEVAGFSAFCDKRGFNLEKEYLFRKLFLKDDFVHRIIVDGW